MNKQEAIEKIKKLKMAFATKLARSEKKSLSLNSGATVVKLQDVVDIVDQIDEKSLCLQNVLARLRELPEHDREVWLKAIMSEFEEGFSHAKWREGYEQGKFEGAVEAEKSNKVVIPNFIATELEATKMIAGKTFLDLASDITLSTKLEYSSWIDNDENARKLALAWFYGYEVEKEKRYQVKFIQTRQHLAKNVFLPGEYFVIQANAISSTDSFTRKELEEAGFGWVFDCEGVEVREVE